MERYLLFHGKEYSPSGGMPDLIAKCHSIEGCLSKRLEFMMSSYTEGTETMEEHMAYEGENTWSHIYDLYEHELVWESPSLSNQIEQQTYQE